MIKYLLAFVVLVSLAFPALSAGNASVTFFDNIEIVEVRGDDTQETSVRVVFEDEKLRILARSNGAVLKEWRYDSIKAAEYSYSKNPRWKTGLGLGAASIAFPPLLLIAIPIGFTKHRRHWVTIRTGDDFAVLKVGKKVRKVFMPAFETRAGVPIKALGDDK